MAKEAEKGANVSLSKFSYHIHLDELKGFIEDRPAKPPVHVPDPWPPAILSGDWRWVAHPTVRKNEMIPRILSIAAALSSLWMALTLRADSNTLSISDERLPADTCLLELEAPANAAVTIDGRHYGARRSFTFRDLDPARYYVSNVRMRLGDRELQERKVLIRGGWRVRLTLSGSQRSDVDLVVQLGHFETITSIAFSPDGRHVLTGSKDGTAVLWDAATGRQLRRFMGHTNEVNSVAFSPDGRQVATGSDDNTARLWDTTTGRQLQQFKGHTSWVNSVAFSPDGRRLLTGCSWDKTARLWDVATGTELRRFDSEENVHCVAFSPDGRYVLAGCGETARLWNAATGKAIRSFQGHSSKTIGDTFYTGHITSMAFSPDGRHVVTGSADKTARLWETATGNEVRRLQEDTGRISAVAFSRDGRQVLVGSDKLIILWEPFTGRIARKLQEGTPCAALSPDGKQIVAEKSTAVASLYDANTGEELRQFAGCASPVRCLALSPDGEQLFVGARSTGTFISSPRLWDVTKGKEIRRLDPFWWKSVESVAFSADGSRLLTVGAGGAYLWNAATHERIRRFHNEIPNLSGNDPANCAVFSPDRRLVLTGNGFETGSGENRAWLWDASTGKEVCRFKSLQYHVVAVAFSPDQRHVLACSHDGAVQVSDAATGDEIRRFDAPIWVGDAAFSSDGRLAALGNGWVGGGEISAILYDVQTGREIRRLKGHSGATVCCVILSPDDRLLVTGGKDCNVTLWDAVTGQSLHILTGHRGAVRDLAFDHDGRKLFTGSDDGTVRIWDVATGRELVALVNLRDELANRWAVVAPDGRFDASDVEEIKGLHWIMPDDPFTPLPIEIFFRNYYEPRLLARILAGEQFAPIRDLQSLNRVQPSVQIAKVEPPSEHPDEVMVNVEVASQSRTFDRGGRQETFDSGVFDVCLFRDGQLVGYHPAEDGPVELDPKTGKARLRFEHIKLPKTAGRREVEFSAYAFNCNRVKSPTHRLSYELPANLPHRKGVAYLICVGINAFENPRWDLRFAAADARTLARSLSEGLSQAGQFERVVTVPLISEAEGEGEPRTFTENTATKQNLRTVFALLAGHPVDDGQRRQLPEAAAIGKAQPEDLVLISFSTHGFNGDDGRFYLFPSDIGSGRDQDADDTFNRRLISTDELSRWLRDVDAGEMVMIVDACHSAASVETEEFKPGPMGSRGLGQLAYNKRMRILAASQASDVAFEDPRIGHGLLTYALCRDGLEQGKADFEPKDEEIMMGEWMQFGVARVPELAEDIAAGKVRAVSRLGRDLAGPTEATARDRRLNSKETQRRRVAQQPSLFDFTKGRDQVILSLREGAGD